MSTIDDIVAAVSAGHPPAAILGLASRLASECPYPALPLLRLSEDMESSQLAALAVFFAATGPTSWMSPLVLHRALSSGHPPRHVPAAVNALTLIQRVATEFDLSFRFLSSWVGWFIAECAQQGELTEDAGEALQVIADTRTGRSFTTRSSLRQLSGVLGELGLPSTSFAHGDGRPDGLAVLRREFASAKSTPGFSGDEEFTDAMLSAAARDQEAFAPDASAAHDTVIGRIGWRTPDRVFQGAQHLLALLETLTQKQMVTNYRFATGSFVVEFQATGLGRALPRLDAADDNREKREQAVHSRLAPLLSMVSTGEFDLSIRTVPSDGGRPTMWSPTRKQAARLLELPMESTSNRMVKRVILKGTDPVGPGGGYAKLQFSGSNETVKATLLSRYMAKGWVMEKEYSAELLRHQDATEQRWDLIALHEPTDDADLPKIRTFQPTELPRVSDLVRLSKLLRIVHSRGSARGIRPVELGVETGATVAYWVHFARALDAIDGHDALTNEGTLAEAGGEPVLRRLFARSRIASALRDHSGRTKLREVTGADVRRFVVACVPGVTGTTLEQRVKALANLVRKCANSE